MESLRRSLQPLGFTDLSTFIGSGNVIFEARERSPRSLETKIEERLEKALKYEVGTFVRTETELAQLAVYHPFGADSLEPEDEINIIFLGGPLDEETAHKVAALTTETDVFLVHDREVYWLRRRKAGGGAYSTVALERTLQQPFTIRTMRTVKRLAEKYSLAYQSLLSM